MEPIYAALFWNTIVLAAALVAQALLRVKGMGWGYALSNLDSRRQETLLARRVTLVTSNQVETLVLWGLTVLVLVQVAPDVQHPHIGTVAAAFLGARLEYVVVTLAGLAIARSAIWAIGFGSWIYLIWIASPELPIPL